MDLKRLAMTVGLGLGAFAVATFFMSRRLEAARYRRSMASAEARFAEERQQLSAELEAAKNKPAKVITKTVTVPAPAPSPAPPQAAAEARKPTAAELLQKLIALRSGTGFADVRAQRQAVVYLEELVAVGPPGLPAIRDFLRKFEDADYTSDTRRPNVVTGVSAEENTRERKQFWQQLSSGDRPLGTSRRGGSHLDFGVPPTLRLGLFDVLHAIGGSEAQAILMEQLQSTGRAIEAAYLAHTLRDMGGDQYRAQILQTTQELLMTPPPADTGARVDRKAKDYLYAVLELYEDASFAPNAARLLVGSDGQLDHDAFDYLGRMLKENVVPILREAYANTSLTNVWDRSSLVGAALPHAVTNQVAAQMVRTAILDPYLPVDLRLKTMRAYEEFPYGDGVAAPTVLATRIQMMGSLMPELTDPDLQREAGSIRQRLQRILFENKLPAAPTLETPVQ